MMPLAILLLDLPDLLVSVLQFRLFLFWNDHVRRFQSRYRPWSLRGKAELFQFIERRDRFGLAGRLIATPDNVAELFLARRLVEES